MAGKVTSEKEIRKALWNRHLRENLDHVLYGDDGELQCNTCMIDFKRDPLKKVMAFGFNKVNEEL